jgi:predicted nucleotidyltransferase
MTKSGILTKIEKNQNKIRGLGVKRIAIFGSFVNNRQTKDSDIDVLVEFRQGEKTFDNFMELRAFLGQLFGRKIDLVTTQAIKPRMKLMVLNQACYARL